MVIIVQILKGKYFFKLVSKFIILSIENNMFHTRGLDSSLKIRERVKEG